VIHHAFPRRTKQSNAHGEEAPIQGGAPCWWHDDRLCHGGAESVCGWILTLDRGNLGRGVDCSSKRLAWRTRANSCCKSCSSAPVKGQQVENHKGRWFEVELGPPCKVIVVLSNESTIFKRLEHSRPISRRRLTKEVECRTTDVWLLCHSCTCKVCSACQYCDIDQSIEWTCGSRVGALPLMLRCETYQVYHGSNAGAMMNIWQFVWAMLTGVL